MDAFVSRTYSPCKQLCLRLYLRMCNGFSGSVANFWGLLKRLVGVLSKQTINAQG